MHGGRRQGAGGGREDAGARWTRSGHLHRHRASASTPDLRATALASGCCCKAPVEGPSRSRGLVGHSRETNFIPTARGSRWRALGQGSTASSAEPPPLRRLPGFPWLGGPTPSTLSRAPPAGHPSASPPRAAPGLVASQCPAQVRQPCRPWERGPGHVSRPKRGRGRGVPTAAARGKHLYHETGLRGRGAGGAGPGLAQRDAGTRLTVPLPGGPEPEESRRGGQ